MKKIITSAVILLTLLIIAAIIGYFTTEKAVDVIGVSTQNNRIQFINAFPTVDENIVIGSVLEIDSSDRYIYLLDQNRSTVHQFDLEGNYVKQIGKVGPGPGELQQPLSMSYDNNHLFIFEQAKMQVQEFTINGEYSGVHIFQGSYEEITVVNDKIWMTNHYFSGMPKFTDMPNSDTQPIYTVYDIDHNHLKTAGNYPSIMHDKDKVGEIKSTSYEGHIFTFIRRLLQINVYEADNGDFVRSINLQGGIFNDAREAISNNYDNPIISPMNIRVNQHGIFIPLQGHDLSTYRFDFDGNLKSSFSFADHYEAEYDDRYMRHLHIKENENENSLRFYIKVYSDYPRILIFDKNLNH